MHDWQGKSGKKYRYSVHPFGATFGRSPANFVFAREIKPGLSFPLYFGETGDLSAPFQDYLALQCMRLSRVTHIHVHFNLAGDEFRRAEQLDLIEQWTPPCNKVRQM